MMASTSKFRDVQGYIHNVSAVRIPANPRSSRYFDFELQEAEQETRVVCFHAERRDEVKGKEESKVAVTVTNVSPCKRKFSDEKEYRMNKFSRVTKAKNLAYQWKEPERRCENYIKEILESKGDGDIVRLKAKVLKKSESTTVYSRLMKRDLKKCDLVVADCSGAMEITLWEEYIDQVTVDSSYCFYEMVVNSFNRKQLNSNRASMISKCDDVVISEEVSDMAGRIGSDEDGSESLTGSILAISIKRLYTCINCKCKIPDIPGKTVFKCPKCELSIKKAEMPSSMTGNVVIKDDGGNNMGRFLCPNAVMQSFFFKTCRNGSLQY